MHYVAAESPRLCGGRFYDDLYIDVKNCGSTTCHDITKPRLCGLLGEELGGFERGTVRGLGGLREGLAMGLGSSLERLRIAEVLWGKLRRRLLSAAGLGQVFIR